MATRRLAGLLRPVVAAVLVVATVLVVAMASPSDPPAAAHAAPTTTVARAPSTTVLDNPFLPEERNLSDCVSAIPKPGCGSEARGGWRQTLVFGVMALGLLVIAWRIATGMRRREPTP